MCVTQHVPGIRHRNASQKVVGGEVYDADGEGPGNGNGPGNGDAAGPEVVEGCRWEAIGGRDGGNDGMGLEVRPWRVGLFGVRCEAGC